jgi:hypothetical protein
MFRLSNDLEYLGREIPSSEIPMLHETIGDHPHSTFRRLRTAIPKARRAILGNRTLIESSKIGIRDIVPV